MAALRSSGWFAGVAPKKEWEINGGLTPEKPAAPNKLRKPKSGMLAITPTRPEKVEQSLARQTQRSSATAVDRASAKAFFFSCNLGQPDKAGARRIAALRLNDNTGNFFSARKSISAGSKNEEIENHIAELYLANVIGVPMTTAGAAPAPQES